MTTLSTMRTAIRVLFGCAFLLVIWGLVLWTKMHAKNALGPGLSLCCSLEIALDRVFDSTIGGGRVGLGACGRGGACAICISVPASYFHRYLLFNFEKAETYLPMRYDK